MSSMNNKTKNIAFFGGSFNPPHIAHIKIGEYLLNNFNFDKILYVPTYYTKHKNYNSIDSYFDRYNMIKLAVEDMFNINTCKSNNENTEDNSDRYTNDKTNKYSKIQISDIEKELYSVNKDYTYTYNVLKFLEDKDKFKNENNKYTIVIGFDSIYNINTWYNYKNLLNDYDFIIFDRKNDEINDDEKNCMGGYHPPENSLIDKKTYLKKLNIELNLKFIYKDNLELDNISSSYIRNKFSIYYKTNDNKILNELNKYINENVIKYILNNKLYKD